MKLGDLIMFQSYIFMLLGPVAQMIDSIQNVQQNLGALDRVVDVLEEPADLPDRPNAQPVTNARRASGAARCAFQLRTGPRGSCGRES